MNAKAKEENQLTKKKSNKILESKDWKEQEMLADLKEASMEGGNSISLSPQRSCLPDLNPTPGNKLQTLKKAKVKLAKAPKNLKTKVVELAKEHPVA